MDLQTARREFIERLKKIESLTEDNAWTIWGAVEELIDSCIEKHIEDYHGR